MYTRCDPDDSDMLEALMPMGFKDNDGLVKMQIHLPCESDYRLPAGCVVVKDDLSDPMEQKFFLERYNELYNTEHDFEWLHSFIDRKGFQRILTVSPTGMAGEILIWQEEYCGIIGYIQTSKRWRRMGVGSCMLGLACEAFENNGLFLAEANVRARIPHVLKMMEKMGFKHWTKGGHDRMYINWYSLGLECEYYKTGNISYAEFNGEKISNSEAYRIKNARTYVDLDTMELHSTHWMCENAAKALLGWA
jgi:GNAT superfamily N-acetyltransferase